ncbi:unnamed protein product [Lactuca saligna]|uniref:DDE Tnp4 domain-containing protein n=1 Tax=Lactuca saligna TaxID=75948 RepID=A0AA36EFS1_LACSI|nr:unnamed protein product [Lactuca saligna]
MEGKGDSDEINLDDDEPLFTSLHESSSSKRKRSKSVSNNRPTKSKSSIYEEKVDTLLDAISSKSTQTYPQNNLSLTIADYVAIVIKFPDFHEGSNEFSQALLVFTKKQNREAFMFPTTDKANIKMDSDDSNSSNDKEECEMEEDREFEMLCGLALQGIILARNLHFRRGHTVAIREPRGSKDKFNYLHSPLRNIIERTFGDWKGRWALLRDMHVNYKYKNQVRIVIASMAIHNYIRKFGMSDEAFNGAQQESYNSLRGDTDSDVYKECPNTRRTSNDDLYMTAIQDIIAQYIITLRR